MKNVKVLIKKEPLFDKCPSCNSTGNLRRSHSRNQLEKFLNHLTIYKTYRCKNCGWRGYRINLTLSKATFVAILIYIGIILASAFITYQIIKRIL